MYFTLGLLKKGVGGGGSSGGGTFPSIESVTLTQAHASSINVAMPATAIAGNLLLIVTNLESSLGGPNATPSGWTQLFSGRFEGFYKWAAGTEGGTTVTVATGGGTMLFSVLRIQGADSAQNPQAAWGSDATTSTPNPPALDPTWSDHKNLFIAWAGTVSIRNIVSYPSGYTFHQQEYDSSEGTIFIAAKQSSSSASEDPGTFTISSSIGTHVATIAVKGAP